GIHLVRDEGLRYNPNDLALHRELAFFFAHKIEGVADDAHFYYKRMLAREWHLLLGEPPDAWDDRIAWIKQVADAPETLAAAEDRVPEITELIEKLRAVGRDDPRFKFTVDKVLIGNYVLWQAVTQQSASVQALNQREEIRKSRPYFAAFDELATNPKYT